MFHAETEAGRLRHQDTYRQAPQPPLPNGVPLRLCVLLPNQGAAPKALRPLSPGGVVCLCLCALLVRGSLIDAEELTNPAAEAFGTSVTLSTALPFSLITALGSGTASSLADTTPLWPIGRDTIPWGAPRVERAERDLPDSH
jgi:hypothetical protein